MLIAEVPRDIAEELEMAGDAEILEFRGGAMQTVLSVVDGTATVIALAQGPVTVAALVRLVQRKLHKGRTFISINVNGPDGCANGSIEVTESSDAVVVAEQLLSLAEKLSG